MNEPGAPTAKQGQFVRPKTSLMKSSSSNRTASFGRPKTIDAWKALIEDATDEMESRH